MISDEINQIYMTDNMMVEELKTFRPHYNVFQLDEPDKMSGNIYVSKPIVGAQAEYYASTTE